MSKDALLELVMDIAEAFVYAGAEIGRVEDTVTRLCKAFGAVKVNVFALTSVAFLTVTFDDGTSVSHTRRVVAGGQTDFIKIERLNALSRKCCKEEVTVDYIRSELDEIKKGTISPWLNFLGSFLAAAGFAVFFGGSFLDAVVSGLFALLICVISDFLSPKIQNKVFFYFVTSLIIGFCICFTARYIPILNADMIIIGDIMVLVPGIAMTMAVKNILIGDTLSALVRFAECLVWTCALAGGFMIPIALLLGG